MTRFPGFVGGTYGNRSVSADCQRCVNLYPEINEVRNAANGEIGALFSTPGETLLGTIGTGPIRGLFLAGNGSLFCVSGNGLYQVSQTWSGTLLGTLGTSTGRVQFADNGVQLMVTDGQGYVWTYGTHSFLCLGGSPGFLGSDCVGYLDQWGFFAQPGTNIIYSSNQLDFTTYNGLNVAYKIGFNDPIVSVVADHQYVWFMGSSTSEPWYNAQNAPPGIVLSRVNGALIQIGCCGPNTPQQIMNTLIFLGDGQHGAGVVWQLQGVTPTRVSTHAVEIALQSYGYSNLQQASAWTYELNGHGFYVLNVPGAPTSWVYDVTSGMWHERTFLLNGKDSRGLPDCHTWANGQHVVGDYRNGNLYGLDVANFTSNGSPIRRMRRSPHFSSDLFRLFYEYFQLDMETGIGLDGTQQGTNPQVMLRYSDDAGHTWSSYRTVTAGAIGGYLTRAKWWRLGQSRNRVWEVSMTDPVSLTILGAELGVRKGTS